MTGGPRRSDSFSARARARMSELPPGGNGTIKVMGLLGKPWALVITAAKPSAMEVTMARRRNRWIFMACLLFFKVTKVAIRSPLVCRPANGWIKRKRCVSCQGRVLFDFIRSHLRDGTPGVDTQHS